jgi:hypothetical protein
VRMTDGLVDPLSLPWSRGRRQSIAKMRKHLDIRNRATDQLGLSSLPIGSSGLRGNVGNERAQARHDPVDPLARL